MTLFVQLFEGRDTEEARKEARKRTDTNPSEAQKKSENYAKGKFWWNSLEIAIENPKGSTRSGVSDSGKKWSTKMVADYGYIKRTISDADLDHLDVFIGPDLDSEVVFVVNQKNPDTGKFDEHKVMVGFTNEKDAKDAYLGSYTSTWTGFMSIVPITLDVFKEWALEGDTGKPYTLDESFLEIFEGVALKGSYTKGVYQRLVAASYMLAPSSEPEAIELYKLLIGKVMKQQKMLQSKYNMVPTDEDPYSSMKAMTKDIASQRNQGVKKPNVPVYAVPPENLSNLGSTNDQNTGLRWVHDLIAHYYGQHAFSGRGEYSAYNRHLKTLPPKVAPILFTEIVGQTSVYKVYGNYCEQKASLLRDFDPFSVGALSKNSPLNKWFTLENKALMPVQGFQWSAFSTAFPALSKEIEGQPDFNPLQWENYNQASDTSLRNPKQRSVQSPHKAHPQKSLPS